MAPPKQKLGWQYKWLNGKQIKPVLWAGSSIGRSNYMAAMDESGNLVLGPNGYPKTYKSIIGDPPPAE